MDSQETGSGGLRQGEVRNVPSRGEGLGIQSRVRSLLNGYRRSGAQLRVLLVGVCLGLLPVAGQAAGTTYTGSPFNFCLPGDDAYDWGDCYNFNWTVLNSSMTTLQSSNSAAVAAVTAVGVATAALQVELDAEEAARIAADAGKVDLNTPSQINLSTVTAALALKVDLNSPAQVNLSTVTTALALKADKGNTAHIDLSTVTVALALKADKGNTAHIDLSTVTIALSGKAGTGSCVANAFINNAAQGGPSCAQPGDTTGAAALNVLKAGDTMTGRLTAPDATLTYGLTAATGSFSGSVTASSATIGAYSASTDGKLSAKGNEAATVANSGTASNAIYRIKASNGAVLDFGSLSGSPYAQYIQATDWGNLALTYPLALNPNGGSVGVGTTNPGTTFEVKSPFHGSGNLTAIASFRDTETNGNQLTIRAKAGVVDLLSTWNVAEDIDVSITPTSSAGVQTEVLRVKVGGRVGLNTPTPAATLDVNGNAQFGSGATKSTFTATGGLNIASVSSITFASGGGGAIVWADGTKSTTAAPGTTGAGRFLQFVSSMTTANFTIVAAIPYDDTIPQITEGGQVLVATMTPTSATNLIKIEGVINVVECTNSGNSPATACIFKGSDVNAIACFFGMDTAAVGAYGGNVPFNFVTSASDTTERNYSVRVGYEVASSLCINRGSSNARKYGGVLVSNLFLTEIMP